MSKFKIGDIAKVAGKDVVGRVIDTFATTTKMMTRDGEKTFPSSMLELIGAYDRRKLVIHPEQQQLREYYAKCEAAGPAAAKFFRQVAEALVEIVHWHPGDATWRFIEKPSGGSLAIRVPTGKTALFHLSCRENSILVELEDKKKCPPAFKQYFPDKGTSSKGKSKDISGGEMNGKYIKEYIEVLKAVYKHNAQV